MPSFSALKQLVLLAASLLALAALAAGCGGGSSSASASPEGSGSTPLTRQQFIKQADQRCEQADEEQAKLFGELSKADPEAGATKAGQEEFVVKAGLPPVQAAAEAIAELTPPSAEAEEAEAFVAAMERAVKEGEETPSRILEGSNDNPFEPIEGLARKYGFKACAEPL
jgi:hypothetical protein